MHRRLRSHLSKKAARTLHKTCADVGRYTKPMHLESVTHSSPLNPKLLIYGESREYVNEVCGASLVSNLLAASPSVAKSMGRYFVSLHVSDQMAATHRQQLRFTFRLPRKPETAAALVGIVPGIIDSIGRATLSDKTVQRAENSRRIFAAELEKQQRREQQAAAAAEKPSSGVTTMTDKEREKYEKKMKKREQRKMMGGKVKVARM